MKKVVCIIQAHTTSTRLPKKVFKDLGGKPMLYHMIDRVSKSERVNDVIIATTVEKEDDDIEKFCINNNVKFFRGSNEDVLSRYYETAKEFKADVIVRITSDCPVIEPKIIDEVIEFFLENNYDYVSPSTELGLIRGLDTEVFSMAALEKTIELAKEYSEHEHVTLFMYRNPQLFSIGRPKVDGVYRDETMRLCVDEQKDYELMTHIYSEFYNGKDIVDTKEVINYLNDNVNIKEINSSVKQKKS